MNGNEGLRRGRGPVAATAATNAPDKNRTCAHGLGNRCSIHRATAARPPQRNRVESSLVTRVPIGVYGHTFAAEARGSSTQPRLCGVPNELRLNACSASPSWK
jgi:hypothetical protein